jgi:hypothetical protein
MHENERPVENNPRMFHPSAIFNNRIVYKPSYAARVLAVCCLVVFSVCIASYFSLLVTSVVAERVSDQTRVLYERCGIVLVKFLCSSSYICRRCRFVWCRVFARACEVGIERFWSFWSGDMPLSFSEFFGRGKECYSSLIRLSRVRGHVIC